MGKKSFGKKQNIKKYTVIKILNVMKGLNRILDTTEKNLWARG